MDDVLQIVIQYSEFVAMMLPWVLISALLIAGIEKVVDRFRGTPAPTAVEPDTTT